MVQANNNKKRSNVIWLFIKFSNVHKEKIYLYSTKTYTFSIQNVCTNVTGKLCEYKSGQMR